MVIKDRSSLRSILGKLSIADSGLADKAVKQLYSSGVKVLFDMWRLPRAGLARRFGVELLGWMDRVLGFEQDIQVYYRAPETFVKELALLQEVTTTEELKPVIYKLLNYMIRFLREQDAAIESFTICLKHEGDKISANTIRLASVTRDKERIKLLINEKLGSIRLSQPVLGVGLQATELLAFKAETSDLLAFSAESCQSRVDHQSWAQLIEQLQNRLGLNAVQFIDVVSDHRPEKAWCYRKKKPLKSKKLLPLLQRPLWLLSTPQFILQDQYSHVGKRRTH